MKSIKLFLIVIIFLFSAQYCLAQQNNAPSDTIGWTEVYDEKLKFSILFPSTLLVDNEDQKDSFFVPGVHSLPDLINFNEKPNLIGHQKSVSMSLEIHSLMSVPKAKDYLARYVSFAAPGMLYQDFEVGKFVGRIIKSDEDERLGMYVAMAVDNKIITVSAYAKKEDKEIYEKFLRSLKIENKPIFRPEISKDEPPDNRISISELQTSSEITEALNQKIKKRKFELKNEPAKNEPANVKSSDKKTTYFRPPIILRQPRDGNYLSLRERFNGTVKVKVEFLSTGKIGDIIFLTDAPESFLKKIFSEIQEIKFLPAEADGSKITSSMPLQFTFNFK